MEPVDAPPVRSRTATVAFLALTAVLSVLAVVRVGRWALAEPVQPLVRPAPTVVTTTTAPPPTTTTVAPAFITGPVVGRSAPTTVPAPPLRSWTWDELARCESTKRWSVTRGIYQGGLQFDARTWDHYVRAFPGYPADAHVASREQQIAVAEKVLVREGPKAWPTCGPRIGMTGDSSGAVTSWPAGPPYLEPD